jgi:hypothetical protein
MFHSSLFNPISIALLTNAPFGRGIEPPRKRTRQFALLKLEGRIAIALIIAASVFRIGEPTLRRATVHTRWIRTGRVLGVVGTAEHIGRRIGHTQNVVVTGVAECCKQVHTTCGRHTNIAAHTTHIVAIVVVARGTALWMRGGVGLLADQKLAAIVWCWKNEVKSISKDL